jgi:hypothetical protein
MIRRDTVPQTPAIARCVPEIEGDSWGSWRAASGSGAGWSWEFGELICPLSWLLAKRWNQEQRPAEASDEA